MNLKTIFAILIGILALNLTRASAQTPTFTHQGNLGFAASGNYDFEFKLFDTPTVGTGTQQGTFSLANVPVTNGAFGVQIDFGSAVFTGAELFLETWWRDGNVGGAYTVLPSREKVTAVYANRSLSAAMADAATNATQLGGLPVSSFIRNTTQQQAGSFNVAGNGTAGGTLSANLLNATTQFNINGLRVFSVNGAYNNYGIIFTASNTFVGDRAGLNTTPDPSITNSFGKFNSFFGAGAGTANTTGRDNSYFGTGAGSANTTGESNSFFGTLAGWSNTTGIVNSFFGTKAGNSNTTGGANSFFGYTAGSRNTTGRFNSIFGYYAGFWNTTGENNSFFGVSAGESNSTGYFNAFFGAAAGYFNTTGRSNAFFGNDAGGNNTTGWNNTFIGNKADFDTSNPTGDNNTLLGAYAKAVSGVTNGTAIGVGAQVAQNDSLILGAINGVNGAIADTNVGIGTTAPTASLHVSDSSTNSGDNTARFAAPNIGPNNSHVHYGTTGDWYIRSASSAGRVILQDSGGIVGIGTNAPGDRLHVNGIIRVDALGSAGTTSLCRNASNQISGCSSSLRYKTSIAPFYLGLHLVNQFQPITFNWKANGEADLGLGAEDVAKVEPLLVTHNEKGEVEGVKYDRVAIVLINAVKEQQAQIKQQADLIKRQQSQLDGLKRVVCKTRHSAKACK
jgi:hypothetical protein